MMKANQVLVKSQGDIPTESQSHYEITIESQSENITESQSQITTESQSEITTESQSEIPKANRKSQRAGNPLHSIALLSQKLHLLPFKIQHSQILSLPASLQYLPLNQ